MNNKNDEVVEVDGFPHIPFAINKWTPEEMLARTKDHYNIQSSRRSVRHFSSEPVPRAVIEHLILDAGTAPSGAHKQPWKFCAISSAELKKKIRLAAEAEELANYTSRMNDQWLKDLAPLGTNTNKEFLETAPWIIVVFK